MIRSSCDAIVKFVPSFDTVNGSGSSVSTWLQDAKNNKNTLVVSLGSSKAKIYHYILISLGMVLTLLYSGINYHSINQFTYCIAFIPLWLNLVTVYKNKEPKLLR